MLMFFGNKRPNLKTIQEVNIIVSKVLNFYILRNKTFAVTLRLQRKSIINVSNTQNSQVLKH